MSSDSSMGLRSEEETQKQQRLLWLLHVRLHRERKSYFERASMPFIQSRLVVLLDYRLWLGTESFNEEFRFIKIQQAEIEQISPATRCRTFHCSGFNINKANVLFGRKENLSALTRPFLGLISRHLFQGEPLYIINVFKSWQPEDTLWTTAPYISDNWSLGCN